MGSATVLDSHAIIITDVNTETGTVYYTEESNERMNRELSNYIN
ncbi:hypothetical protein [Clostridium saccharobutylicum]|nr:hypothetical protein [Clostridium saccharobutylicum]NSB91036.1 hypothetical protein [Clostridium saccharobutylicum]